MNGILILLDNLRKNYWGRLNPYTKEYTSFFNKQHLPDYAKTKAFKTLIHLVSEQSGLDIKTRTEVAQLQYDFAYPHMPRLDGGGHYEKVPKGKVMKYYPRLCKLVFKSRPKLIIGMGNVANQILMKKGSITKNRGQVKQVTFTLGKQSFTTNVIVTFNIETAFVQAYKMNTIKHDFHLGYMVMHDKNIGTNLKNYEYVTSFPRVKQIMTKIVYDHPIISVDTETNSLKPWNKGSKIIVFSLSWYRKQGVCIPFKHKDTPWNAHQLALITKWIKKLMMSDQYKVFHNGKYDIKMMMLTIGLPYARHCVDTLLMHYVGISEEQSISRGLKPLAEEWTTMGDYSKPLKNYKMKEVHAHEQQFLQQYHKNHELYKAGKIQHKLLKRDYKPLVNTVDGGSFNYEWIPLSILAPYAAMDTDATLRLYYVFRRYIKKNKKWCNLIYHFYPALENSLSRMEANGMHIDLHQVNKLKKAYRKGINQALHVIHQIPVIKQFENSLVNKLTRYNVEMAKPKKLRNPKIIKAYHKYKGRQKDPLEKTRFNPNSTDHVKQVLFNFAGYQLPFDRDYMTASAVSKRITSDDWGNIKWYSGGKQTLNYCVKKYHSKFCKALLKYKKLYKLYNDFICKLPKMTDDRNLLHPKFIMSGTVTHRLASRDPNAQQIPHRTSVPTNFSYNYPIKSMVTSRFHHGQIINFDFKSFEVFVVTVLCGEPNLVTPLCNGYDAHKTNASRAFDVPYNKVTPALRQRAKKTTFGCLYSISPQGLADQLNSSVPYAKKVMGKVLNALPVLKHYARWSKLHAEKYGWVECVDGFRRRLQDAQQNTNYSTKSRALREALNAETQGSTTEYTGYSIILIQKIFHRLHMKSRLICTVHDSIVCDSPANESALATEIAIYTMQNLPLHSLNRFKVKDYKNIPKKLWHKDGTFRFPLVSNAGIGNNYNDLVPFNYNHFKAIPNIKRYSYLQLAYKKECLYDYLAYSLISKDKYSNRLRELNNKVSQLLK